MKFPSALTILLIIAAGVAISTWVIQSGTYDTLAYNAADNTFLLTDDDQTMVLPATQDVLDERNIKIPLESFTDGTIYRPISIPDSYQPVEPRPQGFLILRCLPLKE